MAIIFSETVQDESTNRFATSNEVGPTIGTAKPSARVASLNPLTGYPAFIAAAYKKHLFRKLIIIILNKQT